MILMGLTLLREDVGRYVPSGEYEELEPITYSCPAMKGVLNTVKKSIILVTFHHWKILLIGYVIKKKHKQIVQLYIDSLLVI